MWIKFSVFFFFSMCGNTVYRKYDYHCIRSWNEWWNTIKRVNITKQTLNFTCFSEASRHKSRRVASGSADWCTRIAEKAVRKFRLFLKKESQNIRTQKQEHKCLRPGHDRSLRIRNMSDPFLSAITPNVTWNWFQINLQKV